MLATVLEGQLATQQSIFIMRAFKEMRHFISRNAHMFMRQMSAEIMHVMMERAGW